MGKRYLIMATSLIMLSLFTACLCPFHEGRGWDGRGSRHGGDRGHERGRR